MTTIDTEYRTLSRIKPYRGMKEVYQRVDAYGTWTYAREESGEWYSLRRDGEWYLIGNPHTEDMLDSYAGYEMVQDQEINNGRY